MPSQAASSEQLGWCWCWCCDSASTSDSSTRKASALDCGSPLEAFALHVFPLTVVSLPLPLPPPLALAACKRGHLLHADEVAGRAMEAIAGGVDACRRMRTRRALLGAKGRSQALEKSLGQRHPKTLHRP